MDDGGGFGFASAQDCATLCLQTDGCLTFSYNVDFGELCDLYGNTLAEGDFDAGEEGGVPFYDADCFVCSAQATSPKKRGLKRV